MPAYLVSIVEVKKPELYVEYAKAANEAAAKHGGKFLLRGAPAEVLEGIFKGNRVVVSEWENVDKARAYYNSPEYTRAKAKRMEDVAEATNPSVRRSLNLSGSPNWFKFRGIDSAELDTASVSASNEGDL